MTIETTDAILLKRQNLRESSLILTFLTRGFGKIRGIIKGARGPRAQLGINPQLFTLNRIVFYESKRSKLNMISQCDLENFYGAIRRDLERTVYAEYFLELTDVVSAEFDKNEQIFRLLENSLNLLCTQASIKRIARIFEIRIMYLVGLMPEIGSCSDCGSKDFNEFKFSIRSGGLLCKTCYSKDKRALNISRGTINFIEHVKNSPYERASRIKVSKEVGRELERLLRGFVDYHLQGRLKTIEFMRKIGL